MRISLIPSLQCRLQHIFQRAQHAQVPFIGEDAALIEQYKCEQSKENYAQREMLAHSRNALKSSIKKRKKSPRYSTHTMFCGSTKWPGTILKTGRREEFEEEDTFQP